MMPTQVDQDSTIAAHRLLIIEDNTDLNKLYSDKMRKAGHEVHQATTIQEARYLLDQYRFDILLCDIRMGDGLGTDLLKEHQAELSKNDTQIIMVSAEPQYQSMCDEMGVEFFMAKPVALNTLVQLVERLLPKQ